MNAFALYFLLDFPFLNKLFGRQLYIYKKKPSDKKKKIPVFQVLHKIYLL